MTRWESILYVIERLGIGDRTDLYVTDVDRLEKAYIPPFSPNLPVLITGIRSSEQLLRLRSILEQVYPAQHDVTYIEFSERESIQEISRGSRSLSSIPDFGFIQNNQNQVCLYLSPLDAGASFEGFLEIIAHLRDPQGGCPWDLKQTHQTLRAHLLSETYEVLSALDSQDDDAMAEELGDLLLQIVLHAQIASERRAFNITKILEKIYKKIVGRHPHVFGDINLDDVQGVLRNWEKLKAAERDEKREYGEAHPNTGLLDGVPLALPALIQSQEYLERTERIGLTWKTWRDLLAGIKTRLEKMDVEGEEGRKQEFGHILFNIANLASMMGLDAESALREENQEFRKRLATLEALAETRHVELRNLDEVQKEILYG
jgi:tetrapyrrole methylase family protein/MazG family protein